MTEREQTTPGFAPAPGAAPSPGYLGPGPGGSEPGGPGALGSGAHGYVGAHETYTTTPDYTTRPVAFRRADAVAAVLLLLAGIVAAVSLVLHWVHGNEATGWDILRDAFRAGGRSLRSVFTLGYWEPLAILIGGAVLFVLGLLLLVPARTHRFLGVLALLFGLGVAAGVLTPLGQDGWHTGSFDIGFWLGAGVAALGLLGALKALLTGPRFGTHVPG